MKKTTETNVEQSVLKVKSVLTEESVLVCEGQNYNEFMSRGYGVLENEDFLLKYYEALYLLGKGLLEVEDDQGRKIDFQKLLQYYKKTEENAWAKYLTYRDLRSRGYVVREGFGLGIDFRVYERGKHSKDAAKFLILSMQEGKPTLLKDLVQTMLHCQSSKKHLILTVMNRRGEIVYYSVSQLTLK